MFDPCWIHFCVWCKVRIQLDSFVLDIQFSQHNLLKRLSFPHWIILALCLKVIWPYVWEFGSELCCIPVVHVSVVIASLYKWLFLVNLQWSIVALRCCVSFCCWAKWISYTYTIYPLFWIPSHLGYHKALSRVPCAIYSMFSLVIYFIHSIKFVCMYICICDMCVCICLYMYGNPNLPTFPILPLSPLVSMFVLYICVSLYVLQIRSSMPLFWIVYIYVLIYDIFLFLTHFMLYDSLSVHPPLYMPYCCDPLWLLWLSFEIKKYEIQLCFYFSRLFWLFGILWDCIWILGWIFLVLQKKKKNTIKNPLKNLIYWKYSLRW